MYLIFSIIFGLLVIGSIIYYIKIYKNDNNITTQSINYNSFTNTTPPIVITVTYVGASAWHFGDPTKVNPIVELKINTLYKFIFTGQITSHSFRIAENGVEIASPNSTGDILFTPIHLGNRYSYKCAFHSSMHGSFNVS